MAISNPVTFSFGRNWLDYIEVVSESDIQAAMSDITYWLGKGIEGKSVVDIGSGSGINSLCFRRLGAKSIYSFDCDEYSVKATEKMRELDGSPQNWAVGHGSILDRDCVADLGRFDIVYFWGVLHHTGAMWEAFENAIGLVAPGGRLWIALYVKGPRYQKDLALKRKFNAASSNEKRWMITKKVARKIARQIKDGKNPLTWNRSVGRGMNTYCDIIDWLGGLPYEVAGEDEVVQFGRKRGLVLERIQVCREGDLSKYVFSS